MKKIWKHRYQIQEKIGNGGNGQVYKVWDLHLEKEWAMKILGKKYVLAEERFREEQEKEIRILKKISHPNFPRIVDAFQEENVNVLIMDYIQGVTLEEIIKKGPLEEAKILYIAKQIGEALLYLHQQTPTLLYLDLKPSNLIIEESGNVKVIDLGSVRVKGSLGMVSGSFGFSSPEQIKACKGGSLLKEQSDVFSFGMVLYAMAVGNYGRIPVVENKQKQGIYVRKDNPIISRSLEKIIERCTRGNPNRRYPGMREVQKELENCELLWKKKRKILWKGTGRKKGNSQWYLEKSIFCTEGKHSFFIAKKILVLLLALLFLFSEKVGMAKEIKQTENELKVVIRDTDFRKVLVRKGCAYKADKNLLLEIPWEEIQGEEYKLWIECQDQSKQKKLFFVECIYAK